MKLSRTRLLAAAPLLLMLAACAASAPNAGQTPANSQLLSAATALEHNARVLAQRADGIDQSFAHDAHELLHFATEFRTGLATGRASQDDLQAYFDAMSNSYDSLRSEAKALDTMQANSAFELVNGPYQDLAAQMNRPRSSL